MGQATKAIGILADVTKHSLLPDSRDIPKLVFKNSSTYNYTPPVNYPWGKVVLLSLSLVAVDLPLTKPVLNLVQSLFRRLRGMENVHNGALLSVCNGWRVV